MAPFPHILQSTYLLFFYILIICPLLLAPVCIGPVFVPLQINFLWDRCDVAGLVAVSGYEYGEVVGFLYAFVVYAELYYLYVVLLSCYAPSVSGLLFWSWTWVVLVECRVEKRIVLSNPLLGCSTFLRFFLCAPFHCCCAAGLVYLYAASISSVYSPTRSTRSFPFTIRNLQ